MPQGGIPGCTQHFYALRGIHRSSPDKRTFHSERIMRGKRPPLLACSLAARHKARLRMDYFVHNIFFDCHFLAVVLCGFTLSEIRQFFFFFFIIMLQDNGCFMDICIVYTDSQPNIKTLSKREVRALEEFFISRSFFFFFSLNLFFVAERHMSRISFYNSST